MIARILISCNLFILKLYRIVLLLNIYDILDLLDTCFIKFLSNNVSIFILRVLLYYTFI